MRRFKLAAVFEPSQTSNSHASREAFPCESNALSMGLLLFTDHDGAPTRFCRVLTTGRAALFPALAPAGRWTNRDAHAARRPWLSRRSTRTEIRETKPLAEREWRDQELLIVRCRERTSPHAGLVRSVHERVVSGRHCPPVAAETYDFFMNLMSRISNIKRVRTGFPPHNAGFMASTGHKLPLPARHGRAFYDRVCVMPAAFARTEETFSRRYDMVRVTFV